MDLKDAVDVVHKKSLLFRSLDAIVNSYKFSRLWKASDEKEQKRILDHLNKGEKEFVSEWMEFHKDLEPGELSMRVLRIDAAKYGIYNYSRLSRAELVAAVKECVDEERRNAIKNIGSKGTIN